jgi:hypothetical protein
MIRRFFLTLALVAASFGALAGNLTPAQRATLRAAVLADPVAAPMFTDGNLQGLADYYNGNAEPAFIVWRSEVPASAIGNAWVGTDIDGMSALNMQRLQLLLASSPSGTFDMTRSDRRAGFENPFGTNANNASRVAMRAAWKRLATRFEKLFAVGTGSDASPAGYSLDKDGAYIQGQISYTEFQGL